MADTLSQTSSSNCWARDELEYVDERQPINKQNFYKKGPLDIIDADDEPVSAAVSLVVSSARNGVIALCASVAHILREKKKLQERITSLEKQINAVESNSTGISSVNGSCPEHCQGTDLDCFQESPVSQRCDSAPAGFIASGLKCLKIGSQNDQIYAQDDSPKNINRESECCHNKGGGLRDCRTSRHSMPETSSTLVTRIDNDRRETFNRSLRQTSTRSLDISQSLPLSSFVRRKYSTISLRRVRRSPTTQQKSGSTCSSVSVNSNASSVFTEEQPKCNCSSSCVVTVAEVHTPPAQQVSSESSESEAVKLLARALTNVLQGDVFEQERCLNSSSEETSDSQNFKTLSHSELCLPHPLAGCECVLCLSLAADPNCHLFALTTEGGTLLPPGSRVLIEGERLGTVLFLGHDKNSSSRHSLLCGPSESYRPNEDHVRPVGVTVKLWAPDQGEVFVPLNAVICQLDEDVDIQRKESLSNSEYEYLDEDGIDDYVFSNQEEHLEVNTLSSYQTEFCTLSTNEYFIRSPSVSSFNSDISQSLGDLSAYGLDCGDEELAFNKDADFQNIPDASLAHARVFSCKNGNLQMIPDRNGSESHEKFYSHETVLNRTFLCKATEDKDFSRSDIRREGNLSLCDTLDSAISLSFSRRLQSSEENSEPSSFNGTGRESPHFGDTWDSGCSVGRGRCKSDSSGNYSDGEPENRLGTIFAKSLGDSLSAILKKHNIKDDDAFENNKINVEKRDNDSNLLQFPEVFKSYQRRKAVPPLPELLIKEKQLLSSYRYKVYGNVPDHSEV